MDMDEGDGSTTDVEDPDTGNVDRRLPVVPPEPRTPLLHDCLGCNRFRGTSTELLSHMQLIHYVMGPITHDYLRSLNRSVQYDAPECSSSARPRPSSPPSLPIREMQLMSLLPDALELRVDPPPEPSSDLTLADTEMDPAELQRIRKGKAVANQDDSSKLPDLWKRK